MMMMVMVMAMVMVMVMVMVRATIIAGQAVTRGEFVSGAQRERCYLKVYSWELLEL